MFSLYVLHSIKGLIPFHLHESFIHSDHSTTIAGNQKVLAGKVNTLIFLPAFLSYSPFPLLIIPFFLKCLFCCYGLRALAKPRVFGEYPRGNDTVQCADNKEPDFIIQDNQEHVRAVGKAKTFWTTHLSLEMVGDDGSKGHSCSPG